MLPFSLPASITRQTTGGLQLWTDFTYRDGYRIQQHALSERWRLIDADHCLVTSGDQLTCRSALDEVRPPEDWDQINAPFTVLIHGLMRSAYCMKTMQRFLMEKGAKYVTRYSYASTRASIIRHGLALASYVESLPRQSQLSFVGHSMGNIVLRAAIGHWNSSGDKYGVLPRMHRVVMLGPPNQGALIARRLSRTGVFGWINGPGGLELGEHWKRIEGKLAPPPCPFAILAGDLSTNWLRNPLLGPCSDLLVCVEEAKLKGSTEFVTMPIPHALLMTDSRALEYTAKFLLS